MNDILIFIGVMLVILFGLFILVMSKVGFSYSALKDYMKLVENKTILKAVVGIISAMLVVASFVFLIGQVAQAKEGEWFDTGNVFIGLDYHNNGSVFCQDAGASNKINSNMGANINVYKYGNHALSGNYTHHTCAVNPDVNTYDALGFKYEWKIW